MSISEIEKSRDGRDGFIQQVRINKALRAEINELKERYVIPAVKEEYLLSTDKNAKKIEDLNKENELLMNQLEDMKKSLKLKDNAHALDQKNNNQRIINLYKEKEDLLTKIKSMKKSEESARRELKVLKKEQKRLINKNKKGKFNLFAKKNDEDNNKESLQQLHNRILKMALDKQQLTKELMDLRTELKENARKFDVELKNTKEQLEKVKMQNENLIATLDEAMDNHNSEKMQLLNTVKNYEMQIEQLNSEKTELLAKVDELTADRDRYKSLYENEVTKSRTMIEELNTEKEQLIAKISELHELIKSNEDDYINEAVKTEEQLLELKAAKEILEEQLSNVGITMNQLKEADITINRLADENKDLLARINILEADNKELKIKNKEAESKIQALNSQINHLTVDNNKLFNKYSELNKLYHDNKSTFELEVEELRKSTNNLETQNDNLRDKLTRSEKRTRSLDRIIENFRDADEMINRLKLEKQRLTAKLDRMAKIIETKGVITRVPEETTNLISDLKNDKEELVRNNKLLQAQIMEKEAKIKNLLSNSELSSNSEMSEKLVKLQTKFENIQKNYITAVQQKNELLYQLEALQDNNSEKVQELKVVQKQNFA